MITSRRVPRTRRLLIAAFILSVLIHLIGGSVWPHARNLVMRIMHRLPAQHPREDVATSDVIRLERRVVPRQSHRARPQPRPVPPQPPHPRVEPQVPALPRPAVIAPQADRPRPRPAPPARRDIAHVTVHAPRQAVPAGARPRPAAPHSPARLTEEQIAQLTQQFSKTIAQSHADLETLNARIKEPPATIRRYAMNFNGIHADLRAGQGYIHDITPPQRIGNTIWHYMHYEYMYADGHVEEDDIPWPFHYPANDDPVIRGITRIPLQPPPAGYRPNRPLKPILEQFFGGRSVD